MNTIRRRGSRITRLSFASEPRMFQSRVMMPGTRSFRRCVKIFGRGWRREAPFRNRTCAVPEPAGQVRHLNEIPTDETKSLDPVSFASGIDLYRSVPGTTRRETAEAAADAD